jgi:hypothetical protein
MNKMNRMDFVAAKNGARWCNGVQTGAKEPRRDLKFEINAPRR